MRRALLCLSLALAGCGWKARAEALEVSLAERATELSARDASIAERDGQIATLEAKVTDLEARIADLTSDVAGLEADLDAEREKGARILADRGSMRAEIAAMKEALADLEARKKQAEERVAAYRDLVSRFQSLIDAGKLAVRIVDGRMVVVLATDILFDSGAAQLSAGGRDALTEVASVLQGIPERRYQVEGHTDNVPIRTTQYPSNWYLAAARAIGVVNHMIEHGLDAERVSAAAFGDTRPVAANTDDGGRSLNRRIEIVVVPDLQDLPGYDELEALE